MPLSLKTQFSRPNSVVYRFCDAIDSGFQDAAHLFVAERISLRGQTHMITHTQAYDTSASVQTHRYDTHAHTHTHAYIQKHTYTHTRTHIYTHYIRPSFINSVVVQTKPIPHGCLIIFLCAIVFENKFLGLIL